MSIRVTAERMAPDRAETGPRNVYYEPFGGGEPGPFEAGGSSISFAYLPLSRGTWQP